MVFKFYKLLFLAQAEICGFDRGLFNGPRGVEPGYFWQEFAALPIGQSKVLLRLLSS
jgi:hypothetical protein